jgi:2-C-methyl-D-erythritol 2,4-cyclodiphosphate synthase
LELLRRSAALVTDAGYRVHNVDATVVAEAPRVMPHAGEMRARIASALGLAPDAVSVKATTNERLGFVGREEGIAAIAIATISLRGG